MTRPCSGHRRRRHAVVRGRGDRPRRRQPCKRDAGLCFDPEASARVWPPTSSSPTRWPPARLPSPIFLGGDGRVSSDDRSSGAGRSRSPPRTARRSIDRVERRATGPWPRRAAVGRTSSIRSTGEDRRAGRRRPGQRAGRNRGVGRGADQGRTARRRSGRRRPARRSGHRRAGRARRRPDDSANATWRRPSRRSRPGPWRERPALVVPRQVGGDGGGGVDGRRPRARHPGGDPGAQGHRPAGLARRPAPLVQRAHGDRRGDPSRRPRRRQLCALRPRRAAHPGNVVVAPARRRRSASSPSTCSPSCTCRHWR